MPPILEVRNVRKTYTSGPVPVAALRGVDLAVDTGRFLVIMGPSGSGKSTLLNLLGGLERFDDGDILIDGQRLSDLSDHQLSLLRRRKIGFIFQQLNLLPTLTARENVALPLLIDGRALGDIAADVDRALGLVGLSERVEHRPDSLSGGEQQRVAIARCLLTAPAVILADEPTGNLDTVNGRRVLTALRNLTRGRALDAADSPAGHNSSEPHKPNDLGRHTVVMVTHEAAAAAVADEILFLRDGQVVGRQSLDGRLHDAAFVADCYQRHSGSAHS